MMNIFKKCLALSLATILMIGAGGCMKPKSESNEKRMLRHLREKYGQEFITLGMRGGGYFGGGSSILDCYPAGGDPDVDYVCVEMLGTTIDDTYFGIIIREDVEAEVLAVLSDLPLPMKAYFRGDAGYFDETFDGTKTYADFKQWEINRGKRYRFKVTVAVPMDDTDKSEKEEYAKQIFDRLEKDNFHGRVFVRFYPSEVFEKLTRANYIDLHKSEYANFSESLN